MTKIRKRNYRVRNPIARQLHEDPQFSTRVKKPKPKAPKPITVKEATRLLKEESEE